MTPAILASLIFWPLYTAVALILDVIGIVILLPMSRFELWKSRPSMIWPQRTVRAWNGGWLTWLWCNEEDGVIGAKFWLDRNAGKPLWLTAYRWSALRNPSNNLRFIPLINPVINPKRIRSFVKPNFWFVWQGPYAGLWAWTKFRGQTFRFLIGWKLKPEDAQGIADTDIRKPRCGFGVQLKRVS